MDSEKLSDAGLTLRELITMKNMMERIMDHNIEIKDKFERMNEKLDKTIIAIHEETKARIEDVRSSETRMNDKVSKIILRVLGSAGVFILTLILWLVQTKTHE